MLKKITNAEMIEMLKNKDPNGIFEIEMAHHTEDETIECTIIPMAVFPEDYESDNEEFVWRLPSECDVSESPRFFFDLADDSTQIDPFFGS